MFEEIEMFTSFCEVLSFWNVQFIFVLYIAEYLHFICKTKDMDTRKKEPDDYVTFGTQLDPLEEGMCHFSHPRYHLCPTCDLIWCLITPPFLTTDDIASKKPIRIEDQEVRDENGRRRFHGAFTGGFSAGYYNTVDTKEGWRPAEFKSSRSDRQKKEQKPEDFMDQEDLGAFGIAPQVLRAKDDYGEGHVSRKRLRTVFAHTGAIPGKY